MFLGLSFFDNSALTFSCLSKQAPRKLASFALKYVLDLPSVCGSGLHSKNHSQFLTWGTTVCPILLRYNKNFLKLVPN